MNFSAAFPASEAIDAAVQAATAHGIHIAVGAGMPAHPRLPGPSLYCELV